MTDVLIKRELLERVAKPVLFRSNEDAHADACAELRAILAAPRQPEGEWLEVVESLHVWRATNRFGDTCHFGDAGCARVWAGTGGQVDRIELKPVPELYDVNHADAAEVSATEIKVVAWAHCADATRLLCDLGKQRSVPGHYADEFTIPLCRLSDAQRAIAELREVNRIQLEIAEVHGAACVEIRKERDTLRQQLAERDATIERLRVKLMTIASAEPGRHNIEWAKAMAATGNNEAYAKWREAFDQRDKLAEILRDIVPGCKWKHMRPRIDAALAEIDHDNE